MMIMTTTQTTMLITLIVMMVITMMMTNGLNDIERKTQTQNTQKTKITKRQTMAGAV